MVTLPWYTEIGPEHEPAGTVIELPVKPVKAGLVKVKFPVTGFMLDEALQTSMKASHGTVSVADTPVASRLFTLAMFDALFEKVPQEMASTCTVIVHVEVPEFRTPLLNVNAFGCVPDKKVPVPPQVELNEPV
jgi:hypothetical protein